MATQLEQARKGIITDQMNQIAQIENIDVKDIRLGVERGEIVIPVNKKRTFISKPCAIGKGTKVKVNANIGTSKDDSNVKSELEKLSVCISAGADTVMDLSTGDDYSEIQKLILEKSSIPVGTVPVYQAVVDAFISKKSVKDITSEEMIDAFRRQAEAGVDFMTVHSGVTQDILPKIMSSNRSLGVVSRGGAILVNWMKKNNKENPYYEYFDTLIEIAKEYDITLSLGDGLRPGAIADATDEIQIAELRTLAKLAKRAFNAGVQVMIEGPGHVPIQQIQENVRLQKELCGDIPFYILGPLVTDCAAGYDHIAAAIGGAWAAHFGADFLCYVTPAEHIALPNLAEVKEGIIALRIAAHAADLSRNNPLAIEKDKKMTAARKTRNWEEQCNQSFDPEKFMKIRNRAKTNLDDVCSMCSDFCSIKMFEDIL